MKSKIPVSTIVPFGLRLQPELKARLEAEATQNNRSLNAEIAARLERSFETPFDDDRELESNVTLNAVRDALVDIARKANVHEDATRAMGRDLHTLCREALPVIDDNEQVRDLVYKLGDVGAAMQADDVADAQGKLRALIYWAMQYAGQSDRPHED